jgi:C1A family cysteine protease
MNKLIICCLLIGCASPKEGEPASLTGYIGGVTETRLSFIQHREYSQFKESAKSDLTRQLPKYTEQGDLNSCTPFVVANVVEGLYYKRYNRWITTSKLFLYYNSRSLKTQDTGARIDTTILSAIYQGIPIEKYWPYTTSNWKVKPPIEAYNNALNFRINKAYKLDSKDITKALSNGYPVIIGCAIFNQFYSLNKEDYYLQLPSEKEKSVDQHSMIIAGHNNKTKLYLVNNSWGKEWGLNGTCYIPYDYIHNKKLTMAFWILDYVE